MLCPEVWSQHRRGPDGSPIPHGARIALDDAGDPWRNHAPHNARMPSKEAIAHRPLEVSGAVVLETPGPTVGRVMYSQQHLQSLRQNSR